MLAATHPLAAMGSMLGVSESGVCGPPIARMGFARGGDISEGWRSGWGD